MKRLPKTLPKKPRETTLAVRIGNTTHIVTMQHGRLQIEIFDHNPDSSFVKEEVPNG